MDTGNMAWVLVSAALVLFMTPGLALFYGGMDRTRNVLNMLMMNFWCLLIIPILWVLVGLLARAGAVRATTSSATSTRPSCGASTSVEDGAARSPRSPSSGCSR